MAFSNKSTIGLLNEYADVMSIGSAIMYQNGEIYKDAAVLVEVTTMSAISRRCNHRSSVDKTSSGFERVRVNWEDVPTHLGLFNANATTDLCAKTKSRSNRVTCALMWTICAVVRFSNRVADDTHVRRRFIVSNCISVTYAAVVAFVFRHFVSAKSWGEDTVMVLLCDQDTATAMEIYIGSRSNIEIVVPNDTRSYLYNEISIHYDSSITVLTDRVDIAEMCNDTRTPISSGGRYRGGTVGDLQTELLFDLFTYADELRLRKFVFDTDSVVEGVPCSDKFNKVVAVSPRETGEIGMKRQFTVPKSDVCYTSSLKWFNNMVRHANFSGVCYDCRCAHTVSRAIARSLVNHHGCEYADRKIIDEIFDYTTVVGTQGLDDI